MIVRESTHRASLLSQHRATIGIRIPMLVSSLGRAWLSWCSEEEREVTLELLRQRTDSAGALSRDNSYVRRMIRETRSRGYAVNRGEWTAEPNVVSIGYPVQDGGRAIGAINLVLQRNLAVDTAIENRYAPLLVKLAQEISEGLTRLTRA